MSGRAGAHPAVPLRARRDSRGSGVFEVGIGPLLLESGQTLPDATLVYEAYGEPNAARDNTIVVPTSFGTTHKDFRWLIGEGRALDPSRYFIVVVDLFGSGGSSSPSHRGFGSGARGFPRISQRDNVNAQARLVHDVLGMRAVELVVGFSMGAQAAYHWAVDCPETVQRVAVICGSARTSTHNRVFLEGVRAALTSDASWRAGAFDARPVDGLRRMGRVYAGWGMSPAFYRQELFRRLGYDDVEQFIAGDWEARFLRKDGNDLHGMLRTWQDADISRTERFQGDLTAALASIEAEVLLMPSTSDQYFRLEDSEAEAEHLRRARWHPVVTDWGHRVNVPSQNPVDAGFIDRHLVEFLG